MKKQMKSPLFQAIDAYRAQKPHKVSIPKNHPYFWVATWFGCGRTFSAGVLASLTTLPLAWALLHFGSPLALFAFIIAAIAVGIPAANWVDKTSGKHDARDVTIDEVVGQSIAVLFLPTTGETWWAWWLFAFVAFQLCDWLKPQPAKWVDKTLAGGLGVVGDDIIAGLYALLIVSSLRWLVC